MTTINLERRPQRKLCVVRPLSRPSDFWTKDQMQRLTYAPRMHKRPKRSTFRFSFSMRPHFDAIKPVILGIGDRIRRGKQDL